MTVPVSRLRRSSEFKSVAQSGRKWVAPAFVMQLLKREDQTPDIRIGFTVSRHQGNAVKRNRIKRRLRALARWTTENYSELTGYDLVFIGRVKGLTENYTAMQQEITKALQRFKIS